MRRASKAALLALTLAPLAALPACGSTGPKQELVYRRVPPDHTGYLKTWWSDDRPREEGTYRDGRRHSHVRGYHPDGSLAFEGDFTDGVPTGQFSRHYPGGALAIRETHADGALQGARTEFFTDGTISSSVQVADGKVHGTLFRYHPGGSLAVRGNYRHGTPDGRWEQLDEQGRIIAETWYWQADGASAGYLETGFDAEGRIAVQTRMLVQDETWLGRITLWYPNGVQAGLMETLNGMRHGRDIAWDATGRKRSEGRCADDLREGLWTYWDERGFVERSVEYAADVPLQSLDEPALPAAPAAPDTAAP